MPEKLPLIESERLLLRLLEPEDMKAAMTFWQENLEDLAPYGPKMPDNFLTEEFWKAQISRNKKEFLADVSARMFLFEKSAADKVICGYVSLAAILRAAAQFCYLGYGLAKNKRRLGYMSEILPQTTKYAFEELNLHRIMANYMPTNERSGRLLKRLGFSIEGYARDYLYLNGEWQDHILTSLSNPNWQQRNSD
ncbi:MAG: GNAT family N-acetyltransferase [Candidatus Obscuribacterales bacterium]|nr:GNAT family N-acetyltransferase [Candidatus Obscuribacterales bacterium]